MIAFVVRRLFYTIPVVLGVMGIVFFLFNVVGGDPTAAILGKNPKPRDVRDARRKHGLDKPLLLNFAHLADATSRVDRGLAEAHALSEGDARENALQSVFDLGDAAVPPLVKILEAGPADLQDEASEVLLEMTGGGPLIAAGADWAARREGRAAWLAWWEGARGRYVRSLPGRVGTLVDSQFFHFLWGALRFEFGRSVKHNQKISTMIADGIVPSLSLSAPAFVLGILLSIYISVMCAFYRGTWVDRSVVILSVLGMSLSMLIYIIACQYLFAFRLNWFPLWGYRGGPAAVSYLVLPMFIWVLVALGSDVRFFRTVMLDEINQDYVRTAQAKGLSHNVVLFKHVLKNAMIPIITRVVIAIPFLYTGSLLLERFFGIPGLGNMLVDALQNSDLTVVRAMTYIGAILYVIGNLVTDVSYALVDPRIRLG